MASDMVSGQTIYKFFLCSQIMFNIICFIILHKKNMNMSTLKNHLPTDRPSGDLGGLRAVRSADDVCGIWHDLEFIVR
jgi:hypothetical protein